MKLVSPISSFFNWQAGYYAAEFEDDLQFSLRNIVLYPNQAAYIYNCSTGRIVEFLLGKESPLGYSDFPYEYLGELYEVISPNDSNEVIKYTWAAFKWAYSNQEAELFQSSIALNYRVRSSKGQFKKVIRQSCVCGMSNGLITHTMGVLTDVTYLNVSSKVSIQVFGPGWEYFDADIPEIGDVRGILSPRECEILKLLARGMTSREIAECLSLSRHTVNTHRKNMINRVEAKNSIELINLGRDLGLY